MCKEDIKEAQVLVGKGVKTSNEGSLRLSVTYWAQGRIEKSVWCENSHSKCPAVTTTGRLSEQLSSQVQGRDWCTLPGLECKLPSSLKDCGNASPFRVLGDIPVCSFRNYFILLLIEAHNSCFIFVGWLYRIQYYNSWIFFVSKFSSLKFVNNCPLIENSVFLACSKFVWTQPKVSF